MALNPSNCRTLALKGLNKSRCACGFYRSLGVHMSKVRSITLDSWEPELLKVMTELGNARVNQIFEAVVGDEYNRPVHSSVRSEHTQFAPV